VTKSKLTLYGRGGVLVLFFAALAIRLIAMAVLETPQAAEGRTPWEWGGETACLAASLVEGRGYGDPWAHGTGLSGWLTPPYPVLVAALMRLGGGVTPATATMLYVLQSLAAAATCVLVLRLGRALGIPAAGLLGAWLFAFFPPSIWNAVKTVWDTTWVALAVVLFLERLVSRHRAVRDSGRGPGAGAVLRLGLGYGALCFLNPATLALGPAALAYVVVGQRGLARGARSGALFLAGALVLVLPWMARNARVVDSFSLRPNLGVELMIGNNDESFGRPQPFKFHPSHVASELERYRELGEGPYCRECRARALDWIGAHPLRFAQLCLLRAQYFWVGELPTRDARTSGGEGAGDDPASWIKFATFFTTGAAAILALFRLQLAWRERGLITAGLLLFSAPYVLTHVSERYRFPVDPLLVLLGAWLLCDLARAVRGAKP